MGGGPGVRVGGVVVCTVLVATPVKAGVAVGDDAPPAAAVRVAAAAVRYGGGGTGSQMGGGLLGVGVAERA